MPLLFISSQTQGEARGQPVGRLIRKPQVDVRERDE